MEKVHAFASGLELCDQTSWAHTTVTVYSLQFTKGPQWGDAQRRPGSTRTAKGKAHPSTLTRHATYEGESELGNTDKGRTHARVMTHEC